MEGTSICNIYDVSVQLESNVGIEEGTMLHHPRLSLCTDHVHVSGLFCVLNVVAVHVTSPNNLDCVV